MLYLRLCGSTKLRGSAVQRGCLGALKVAATPLGLPYGRLANYPMEIRHRTAKELEKYRIDSKMDENADDAENV